MVLVSGVYRNGGKPTTVTLHAHYVGRRYEGRRQVYGRVVTYKGRVFFESSTPLISTRRNGAKFVSMSDALRINGAPRGDRWKLLLDALTDEPIRVYSAFRAAALDRRAEEFIHRYSELTGEPAEGLFYAIDSISLRTDELPA